MLIEPTAQPDYHWTNYGTMYTSQFSAKADVKALKEEYVGKRISELPTPAFLVDRGVVKANCDAMLDRAQQIGSDFRAHVKTHKCTEGVNYQLANGKGSKRVVVSTLMEAWSMQDLYATGVVEDVLYGLPPAKSRIPELIELKKHVKHVRLMIDHISQLQLIKESSPENEKWSVFIKVDMGTHRAGLISESEELQQVITGVVENPNFDLYGFYCHAGHSYSSKNEDDALGYLYEEIRAANAAAEMAKKLDKDLDLVLSAGATPTAHAAGAIDIKKIGPICGKLEIHAGNYPFCDLQQMATHLIDEKQVACSVLAEVVSHYPNRGEKSPGEALINAGVIAIAREPGPDPGFGKVKSHDWLVGRLSQEHGILVPLNENAKFPVLGDKIEIIPQHSCITANSFQWYYVIDGDDTVVDIWVPWRGW